MTQRKTIFQDDTVRVYCFTDPEKPEQVCYGIYGSEIDPEFGGHKEIAYLQCSTDSEVMSKGLDSISKHLRDGEVPT